MDGVQAVPGALLGILSATPTAQPKRTLLATNLPFHLCTLWPVASPPTCDSRGSLLLSAQLRPAPAPDASITVQPMYQVRDVWDPMHTLPSCVSWCSSGLVPWTPPTHHELSRTPLLIPAKSISTSQ